MNGELIEELLVKVKEAMLHHREARVATEAGQSYFHAGKAAAYENVVVAIKELEETGTTGRMY